jgi:conjugal transfer/entry exclusion protein
VSAANEPFESLIEDLHSELNRLDPTSEELSVIRYQMNALERALGRYCDVMYPMPYKRPDDEVLDIATSALGTIRALIKRLS